MSEIIQAICPWSKTSGETDLGRHVYPHDNSPKDNSPHIKGERNISSKYVLE